MPSRPGRRARPFLSTLAGLALCFTFAPPARAHVGLHDQIEELDVLISQDPRAAGLYIRRGELRRVQGELDLALRDFERALALDPSSAEPAFHVGRTLLEMGRAADAVELIDLSLRARSDDPAALFVRGRALAKLGRHMEAASDFTGAIRAHELSNPPQPDLYLELASAQTAAGPQHLEEALRGLEEGIGRLGPAVSLQLAAIDLEVRLGRHDAALVRLDAAASRSRNQARWLARRGEILEAAGRPSEARAAFVAALESLGAMPERRRASATVAALEASVRDALARLPAVGDVSGVGR